jgi:hypothetical protein
MDLYLQFGHGMIGMSAELLGGWSDSGVIMSPRDLTPDQLRRVAKEAHELGAEPLLDPQCFVRDANHGRLTKHAYWKRFKANSTGSLLNGTGADDLLRELAAFSSSMELQRHILPGLLASPVSDDWFHLHERLLARAPHHFGKHKVFATVAVSTESMKDEAQVEAIVERAEQWDAAGFYVVAEAPATYLVDDGGWLANLLILASGLKLLGREVVVGYCSHQMLCLASANIDTIASGTWLNVRAFQAAKFYAPDEDSISRRTTWYYCPHALSEYKLPALDIAQRLGLLQEMKPAAQLGSTFADVLFQGAMPTSTNWPESMAFRHYLTCLRSQARTARKASFSATIEHHRALLDKVEEKLKKWRRVGVAGAGRDFSEVLDANRGALAVFEAARAPRLKREW